MSKESSINTQDIINQMFEEQKQSKKKEKKPPSPPPPPKIPEPEIDYLE